MNPSEVTRLTEVSWKVAHGFRGSESWIAPRMTKFCSHEARPGYASELAHEYMDEPEVLEAKVDLLAAMLKASENCLVYTGAGLSTAAGIGDYASRDSSGNSIKSTLKLLSGFVAQPTYSHYALAEMCNAGIVKEWIQQNHDGLPQKAGIPQERMNEIHGAWFDPSNPVVPMSGDLRTDLFERMLKWEDRADLTLSMGTSMCGMNSDRVFVTVARKAQERFRAGHTALVKEALGGVIISLQRTQHDKLAALRIFAKIDQVMALLMPKLGLSMPGSDGSQQVPAQSTSAAGAPAVSIQMPPTRRMRVPAHAVKGENVFAVPYDRNGRRYQQPTGQSGDSILSRAVNAVRDAASSGKAEAFTLLRLSPGSHVRLVSGPHAGDVGEVVDQDREGHYNIRFMHLLRPHGSKASQDTGGVSGKKHPMVRKLGWWWVEAAVNGTVDALPVVNCAAPA